MSRPSAAMFPQTATIRTSGETHSDTGVRSTSPSDLSGHVNIPAQLSEPLRGEAREYERSDGSHVRIDRYIYLNGHYPSVTERHSVACDGQTFDIEAVTWDSHKTYTRLAVRLVR